MTTKILAVDDEPDVLVIIKTGLEIEGYDVVTAANGVDALSQAREEKPDLIILDVMMPKMDGFEVLDKLKQEEATSEIPVIMLTGISEREKIQKALISGIVSYIVKPFNFDDVLAKVREGLEL